MALARSLGRRQAAARGKDVARIPAEIYERVIDRYSQDVMHRLLALLELRDKARANGLDIKNRLIDWHEQNVRDEWEKSK